MADYAEKKLALPPRPLVWGWEMEQFRVLPEVGALWDQPAGVVARARHALNVYNVYDSFYKSHDWSAWARAYPDAWRFKVEVDKLREQTHAG